jgi:hypothetical protein
MLCMTGCGAFAGSEAGDTVLLLPDAIAVEIPGAAVPGPLEKKVFPFPVGRGAGPGLQIRCAPGARATCSAVLFGVLDHCRRPVASAGVPLGGN